MIEVLANLEKKPNKSIVTRLRWMLSPARWSKQSFELSTNNDDTRIELEHKITLQFSRKIEEALKIIQVTREDTEPKDEYSNYVNRVRMVWKNLRNFYQRNQSFIILDNLPPDLKKRYDELEKEALKYKA